MPDPSIALITGGAKRIGKSVALHLSRMNHKVIVHYHHSETEAQKTVEEIRKNGGDADVFHADFTDLQAVQKLCRELPDRFPGLNLLINNASVYKKRSFNETTLHDLEENFRVHAYTPFLLSQAFGRMTTKGNIINILDTHISESQSDHFAYLLSKKALSALTQMTAIELAPHVRVNGVCPGLILPPEGEDELYLQKRAKEIPLQRKGNVRDINETITFLLRNAFVTGQILYCDGGENLL